MSKPDPRFPSHGTLLSLLFLTQAGDLSLFSLPSESLPQGQSEAQRQSSQRETEAENSFILHTQVSQNFFLSDFGAGPEPGSEYQRT